MRGVAPHGRCAIEPSDGRLIHRNSLDPKECKVRTEISAARSILMLDIVMLALALGLFAAGISYAYACERL